VGVPVFFPESFVIRRRISGELILIANATD